jgi:putative serine protease PepD
MLAAVIVVSSAATGVVVHEVDGPSSTEASKNTILTSTGVAPTSAATGDVHAALAAISPSVVIINTVIGGSTSTFGGGFGGGFGQSSESGTAAGTGIIESADGVIVTNAHVIADATSIKVTIPGHGTVSARVLGSNSAKDLAAIKVDGFTNLKPAVFAKSANVQVGDQVLAVGNAEGYGGNPSVSEGIISAIGRSLPGSSGTLTNLLQTDAAINPGNSGGPLVDTAGRVVGIDTAIATGTSSEPAVNIGFAIPSDAITAELPALIAGATTQTAYLGVGLADTGPAVIGQVADGSPAASAGLQAGDTITKIDGKAIASSSDAVGVIGSDKPGQTITLTITDGNGGTQQVQATLTTKPTTN